MVSGNETDGGALGEADEPSPAPTDEEVVDCVSPQAARSSTRTSRGMERDRTRARAMVDAVPFHTRVMTSRLAGRPGSRLRSRSGGAGHGYSCGTAPALHRLRHLSAGLSAAAPDAVFGW